MVVRLCYHTPVLSHTLIYHTPKHTLCVSGRAITPPFLTLTPGTDASCTLSPGVHNISHPPQYNTPGDNIFKPQNVITGVSYTCVRYIRYKSIRFTELIIDMRANIYTKCGHVRGIFRELRYEMQACQIDSKSPDMRCGAHI